jgi:quinoprotein glucose dehydrogenase
MPTGFASELQPPRVVDLMIEARVVSMEAHAPGRRRPDMAIRSKDRSDGGASNGTRIAAALLFGLLGLVLLAGGLWLMVLGGSWYYAIAGVGLLATAWFLWRARAAAVAVYALVWICTLGWTYWEVGTDWWAWAPRMVAPTVLLLVVCACLPLLSRRHHRHPVRV